MDLGVAIHLAGRCLQNARLQAFGQTQHIDGAVDAGLGRLHRVPLIVHGRGRACEVVDLIDLDIQRKSHIVPNQLKAGVPHQMKNIGLAAGKKIVHTQHLAALCQQALTQM